MRRVPDRPHPPLPGPPGAALPRLLLVSDRHDTGGRELVEVVVAAARGGLRFVQVREKDLDAPALEAFVRRLRAALPPDTVITVNSDAVTARACGVGLHCPEADTTPRPAEITPVGRSMHSPDAARAACALGADYLVVGTIFMTDSKPGKPGAGPAIVRAVVDAVEGRVPVYAIGGITAATLGAVIEAGAHGIAVRSAILRAPDPAAATAALQRAIDQAVAQRSSASTSPASIRARA